MGHNKGALEYCFLLVQHMSPSFQKCELPAQCGVIQAGLGELLLLVFPMFYSMSDIEEKSAPGPQHADM